MTRATVMGSGSWGTAFAAILADAGSDVTLWARREGLVEVMRSTRRNTDYLPELLLPDGITVTADVAHALEGAQIVVLAVPSQTLRANLTAWKPYLPREAIYVSLMKGIELGTHLRMSEVILDVLDVEPRQVVALSGPNLAKEIAAKQPAAAVVASPTHSVRAKVAEACATPYFRPYTNADVVGTEIGGAVKNIIALAVGMAHGLGMGENTCATILTRGLAETARLGAALGADPHTFLGLAGVGDMSATCNSRLSRNYSFGVKLAGGQSVEQIEQATNQTAEGVKSCRSVVELAQSHGVEMTIVEAMYAILYEGRTPAATVDALMARARKSERA